MKYFILLLMISSSIFADLEGPTIPILPKREWVEMQDVHIWITESHSLVIKMCGHFYHFDGELLLHRGDCGCKDDWWLND